MDSVVALGHPTILHVCEHRSYRANVLIALVINLAVIDLLHQPAMCQQSL